MVDMMQRTRQAGFGAEVKRRIMLGTYALSAGYYDAYYGQAQKVRTLVRRELDAAYERFDLLVGPTAPTVAFPIGEKADDPLAMYLNDVFTIPVNLAGNAAVSVPAGLSDGLPVGLQLIAPALGEATMLRAAWAFEQDLGLSTRPVAARRPGPPRARGGTPVTAPVAEEVGARRYETVIGIETHCELGTATKMFCACPTVFGAEPNTQTCPVCLGEPGSLPVANGRAVEYAARIGLALHCRIAERSQFHRKNYFYPDMPKNYQISQYDEPLCVDGWLDVDVEGEVRRIGITRVHLEEDTGKTLHVGATGRIHGADYSLVDYNRAGIPLVEIVSEPDLRTADEARAYAEELRAVLLALGVSDAKLEEGSMRFDVNVSIRPVGHAELGTKVELKNLNSLRSLHRAVAYEADRQRRVLADGGKLVQETRHWDEGAGRTEPMRSKEFATDYRYFPEPDLVPIEATASWVDGLRAGLPELPAERRARLAEATGLPAKEVGWLVRDPEVLAYFEAVPGAASPRRSARARPQGRGQLGDGAAPARPARVRAHHGHQPGRAGAAGRAARPARRRHRLGHRGQGRAGRDVLLGGVAGHHRGAQGPGPDLRQRRAGGRGRPGRGRQPRPGREVPRRQAGRARRHGRPGHARDPRPGQPQAGQRPPGAHHPG